MTGLPTSVAARLGKLLPRLASPFEGEVVATGRAIERTLKAAGLDLNDLAQQIKAPTRMAPAYSHNPARATSWTGQAHTLRVRSLLMQCQARAAALTSWEIGFLDALRERIDAGLAPTPRQAEKLAQVARKVGIGGAP